jgi:hypothetical protein
MASGRGFTGFESGSTGDASGGTIGTTAGVGRSGPRYLSVAMIQGYTVVPAGAMTVSVLALGGGAGFICRMFIKNTGIGGTSTTQGIIELGINGVRINTSGQILVGDATRGYVAAGTIPADGAWHELVIVNDQHSVTMPAAASPSPGSVLGQSCTLTVYNFVGGGAQNSSCIAVSIDGGAFIGHGRDDNAASRAQTDIMIGNSLISGGTGQFLLDDIQWAWNDSAVPTLPTNKGVFPVAVTAISASSGFTGGVSNVSGYPKATSSALPPYYTSALQSTSPSAAATFQHQTHFTLVLGSVEAVKPVIFARRASGGTVTFDIKVGGSTVKSVASAEIPQTNTGDEWRPTAYDYTGWTQSAFDALTFGVAQTAAGTLAIGAAMLEVIAAAYAPVTPNITSVSPPTGTTLGGTVVTITGTFNPQTSILFGEYGSAIVSITETTIVVTTPAHPAGTVDVIAVSPTTGGAALTFTYPSGFTFIAPAIAGTITLVQARRDPEVSVTGQLGNGQNSFGFSVNGSDAASFTAGKTVDMQLGTGQTIAKGVILQTEKTVEDGRFNERVDCRGNDNVWVLNSKLVKGSWAAASASAVATEIINKFAPNFSSAQVAGGLPAITLNLYLDANVGQALDKICALLPDGHWYLDTANVIHLFNGVESGGVDPAAINDSSASLLLAEQPITIKTDMSQVRNRVYVRGAGSSSSTGAQAPVGQPQGDPGGADPWVWTINGTWMALLETGGSIDTNRNTPGLTWYWQASYIFVWTTSSGRSFATWTSRWPAPTPLTNPYTVGYITGSNQVGLSVDYVSLDTRVTGLEVYREIQRAGPHALNAAAYGNVDLFTPNQDGGHGPFFLLRTFTRAEVQAGHPLHYLDTASEDTLVGGSMKKYSELVGVDHSATIFNMAEDTTAQAALAALLGYGDGVREYLIVDPSITTQAQALARAQAELALWANPIVQVTYATTDQAAKVGRKQSFNLTHPALVGDFKIQTAQLKRIHVNDAELPVIVATASSVRFELNDLFARVLLDTDNGGGASGSAASDPNAPASGAAATAAQLSPGKSINGVLFNGAADISINAAPDHPDETPSGLVNGSNAVYTTAASYKTGSLVVMVNGIKQKKTTHWSETTSTTFTMSQAPATGDLVTVSYEHG